MIFKIRWIALLCLINLAVYNQICAVKIAFFINFMYVTGVEVAVYDFADFNEKILGNESIIVNYSGEQRYFSKQPIADVTSSTRDKFIKRFGNKFFDCQTMKEMDETLQREDVKIFYVQKAGKKDYQISRVCKNAIHVVFQSEPHGNAYAAISPWLSRQLSLPCVPLMVRLSDTKETLHTELNIPQGAVIFGRHGGAAAFDIDFAKEAVKEIAGAHKNWYFLFLNTNKFCDLPNVIHLPITADMEYKTRFINTCDVMLHARACGETFGLACGEFSIKNKAVITYADSFLRNHIEMLGNKGLFYKNKQDLMNILLNIGNNINDIRRQNWDAYSENYSPEVVMKRFDEFFIQPLLK